MNFYKVYKTVNKLLNNRGYHTSDLYQAGISMEDFNKYTRDELQILVSKLDNDDEKVFVFFPEDEKVGVKTIREYKVLMVNENVNKAIIVVKGSITPFAKTNIEKEIKDPMSMEIFNESELLIDITEHSLVPKHELMSHVEKELLLQKYNIKENQLPRILSTDPVARYYGFKKRDLIKITRLSETSGIYYNYRIVV